MEKLPVIAQAAAPGGAAGAGANATGDDSREEMRSSLQRRVSGFGGMMAALFGMFLAWRLLGAVLGDGSPTQAFLPWQALGVAAFAAVWLLCRGRARSVRAIRVIEESGLFLGCFATMMMSFHVPYEVRPDYILILSLTYTLIARSILVPSPARLTLALGLVIGAGLVASVYFLHRWNHDPRVYTPAASPLLRASAEVMARRNLPVVGLWWTASVAIATATSRVIYGLRAEVRDARRLGQYTLLEKLGEGGMGVVYRASHAMLRRPTAVKLLQPSRHGADSLARFEREVQLTAALTHPNTIRIFDYGRTPDGVFYYAMEYLEGASLADVVALTGPMPAGRVIHLLEQVAGALAEAHRIGLIHRDIKPANIFLTEQGGLPDVAKVLDFGLVKQIGAVAGDAATQPALTQVDGVAGTPLYMAPEAITAPELVDARTDLYALGAVGYFLVTGCEVFTGRSVLEVCGHHLHTPPVPPSERLGAPVPADLEALLLACLDKVPSSRPTDARSLQRALRACRDAGSWTEEDARRWLDDHRARLGDRQARTEVEIAATVDVDLAVRTPARPGLPDRRAG
ncbi:MAG TPA: serine/threonine-protein kinase [Kofleriaceae bacterium]|nr:serine/threonine-protein kinase [Kofleriaceae bacterium]